MSSADLNLKAYINYLQWCRPLEIQSFRPDAPLPAGTLVCPHSPFTTTVIHDRNMRCTRGAIGYAAPRNPSSRRALLSRSASCCAYGRAHPCPHCTRLALVATVNFTLIQTPPIPTTLNELGSFRRVGRLPTIALIP